MKSILLLDVQASSLCAGINRYCKNLIELFNENPDFKIRMIDYDVLKLKSTRILGKKLYSFCDLFKYSPLKECDIVHINGFASLAVLQFFIVSIFFRKKIVYTPHFHPFVRLNHPLLAKLFFYSFIRPCLFFVKTIITINKEDTAFFKKFHHNVIRIPNWIQGFPQLNTSQRRNEKMILFIGRADSNKGIEHLYSIPINKYEIHCVTSGKLNRADFIIHRNISETELSSLYSQAALVVIPSRYEAFSYVALEALSFGTPILISERVRIGDYVSTVDGVYHFTYHDFDEFNKVIEQAINNHRLVSIDAVKKIFDKELIRNEYIQIYQNI